MLFWRYAIAILALGTAATLTGLKLSQAWRDGAWRIVLLGATLGAGQTLCFWESIKTLETSIAVLLFYTYPAVTLALDRLVFGTRVRPLALLCIAAILLGAALITGPGLHGGTSRPARPRLGAAGAAALRGVSRDQCPAAAPPSGADRRGRSVQRHGGDVRPHVRLVRPRRPDEPRPAGHCCCLSGSAPAR